MKRPFPFHSNLVWPPPVLVGLFIVIYGLISAGFWMVEQSVPGNPAAISNMPEVIRFRAMILAFGAALYAAFRLSQFHPACNRQYADWLKLSPWTADRPLPAGPVHLVWQDAVVVAVLTAVGVWSHVNALVPLIVFIGAYLAGFTLLLALTRQRGPCLVLGFLWPSLMLPGVAPVPPHAPLVPAIAIVAAIVCVVWYGHRQSLKTFPWEFIKAQRRPILQTEVRMQALGTPAAAGTQHNLGWPFLALSPKVRPPSISMRTNLALGVLAGWWSFCIIKASTLPAVPEVILFFAVIAALFRWLTYVVGGATPFNIPGRIASGRIVVPGYDKILVTPLVVVIAAMLGSVIINHSGRWYPEAESVVIAILSWVLFGGGPTLRNWALTGQLRLRPPAITVNQPSIRQV